MDRGTTDTGQTSSAEVDRPAPDASAVSGDRARPPSVRHQHLFAAAILALLIGIFFSPIVLHHATFSTVAVNQANTYPWAGGVDRPVLPPQADQAQYSYPRQVFLDHALKRDGVIPLWDPYTFGGHPAFASGPGLAYPPRLLVTLLLDPSWAHDVYLVVHLLAAGMAMFALMKHFGLAFPGALLSAVAWSFGSYCLGWIMLEPFAAVAALLPLALLAVRRWHDGDAWSPLLVAGLALGLLYLGSSNELALVAFVVVAGYTGCMALARTRQRGASHRGVARWAPLAAPFVLMAAALGVAAVGVLPFVELMGRVGRASLPYSSYVESTYTGDRRTTLTDFLHAFVPAHTPLNTVTLISESTFVGTLTALLALPAVFLRRPGTALGRGASVLIVAFIVGTPITWIAFHLVPGLSSLNGLARSLFVWNLGIAVLGGIGLDAALAWLRRALTATGGSSPSAGDADLVPRPSAQKRMLRVRPSRSWLAGRAVGAVGLLCVAVTAAQLTVYGRHANPGFQPRTHALLFPSTPAVEALRQVQGPAPGERRALPLSHVIAGQPPPDGSAFLAMPGNAGQALDLRLATGYENALPERTLQLGRYLRGEDLATVLREPPTTTLNLVFPSDRPRTELFARLGIAAVLAPPGLLDDDGWRPPDLQRKGMRQAYLGPDGVVLEVANAAPRAMVVSDALVAGSADEALTGLLDPAFDPRRTVILESPQDAEKAPAAAPGATTVEWLHQDPNGARLSVTAPRPSWLVVLESFDPGWRATVAGRPAKVERANFAFQAIRIPAGQSAVKLTYRPPAVLWGAAVSGATVAAIMALATVEGTRRRRRRRRGPDRAGEAVQPGSILRP